MRVPLTLAAAWLLAASLLVGCSSQPGGGDGAATPAPAGPKVVIDVAGMT